MDYDYITQLGGITYGVIRGDESLLFVKPGLGSDCYGRDNKYLTMAGHLHSKFGCSVIVSSNPHDDQIHTEDDRAVIEGYLSKMGFKDHKLLLFAHSNGGIKGLILSGAGLSFSKMVLVNMPLMINFHKTKGYISRIPKTSVIAVYSERDPSFPYVPYLKGKFDNLRVIEVENADHSFNGMLEEFVGLSEILFEK